jgi:CRP/FNR family cyclic AMP-dependent transcriptional regulator
VSKIDHQFCRIGGSIGQRICRGVRTVTTKSSAFELQVFLTTEGSGRKMVSFSKGKTIFAQGDASDGVFIVQAGLVTLSARLVGNKVASREAIIDIVSEKDFVGKDSIAGEPLRTASARALTDCRLLRITRAVMVATLAQEVTLANALCASLLTRDVQYQQDLVDQRCNYSEKRLARVLLRIAQYDRHCSPETKTAKISHVVLAQMVGTTRARVCFFMKKFEAAGFIEYTAKNRQRQVSPNLLDPYANAFRSYT